MADTDYPLVTSTTDKRGRVVADTEVQDLLTEWQRGKDFVDKAIRDFKRLDTIANAQYEGASGKNPNIGDTTVAGMVREIMRTAVKKLPHISIAINGSKSTLEAIICRNRVEKVLLNPTTFGKGLVSILQLGGRGSIARGFNVFQASATKMYGQFGVVPKLIHFNDFSIEPGTQEGSHSPYFWIRTKWTPGKLNDVISRESKKPASKRTYNLDALKAMKAAGANSNGTADYAEYLTPMEQSKIDADAETYDILTRYCNDTSKPIITITPGINQKLRVVENRSKFGFPRTLFLVIDPAELSPFGDSRVRLASPNQNFLMALRQNVATTWLYNSKPTMVKTGLFTGATNLKSGGVITSTDPNAKVQLLTLDTATSQQYPTISQEITKQIQNMMGMNPGQSLGAIGDSKTGVGAQKQVASIDNSIQQITNIIQEFLAQYIISGLDLYLCEQDGKSVIYIDDATREDVLRLPGGENLFIDPDNPNAMEVDWNALYAKIQEIDVTVDTTMSKEDYSNEKRADLQDAVTVMSQTTDPNDPEAMARKKVVEDKLLDETAPELATALNNAQPTAPVAPQPGLTPPMQ